MNTRIPLKGLIANLVFPALLCFLAMPVRAQIPPLGDWEPEWLDYWSFDDSNWMTYYGYGPVSVTNLSISNLGNGPAVIVDSTNVAWLHYNILEADGTNHLRVDRGSVMFWFASSWSSTTAGGTGPGNWGRLLEVGSYTTNASYGWWSLYTDPAGANIYFGAQTNNGSEAVYLSAPIAWETNHWHFIALTYSGTNSALYLDGALVTNGFPATYWPGPDVLAKGFWIGSDSNGVAQAHGMFDDFSTYDHELEGKEISDEFDSYFISYYLNPFNPANLGSAPSTPTTTAPIFNAVTGAGYLTAVSTNTSSCVTSGNVWITNTVATKAGTNMTLAFEMAGGTNGLFYDVFANSILPSSSDPSTAWAWMGQGNHCVRYTLPNLPGTACFLILGTPQNSDGDGLTDAYEKLVSKTDPLNSDTDGDGVLDGWEVVFHLDPKNQDSDGDGVIDQAFAVLVTRPGKGGAL